MPFELPVEAAARRPFAPNFLIQAERGIKERREGVGAGVVHLVDF